LTNLGLLSISISMFIPLHDLILTNLGLLSISISMFIPLHDLILTNLGLLSISISMLIPLHDTILGNLGLLSISISMLIPLHDFEKFGPALHFNFNIWASEERRGKRKLINHPSIMGVRSIVIDLDITWDSPPIQSTPFHWFYAASIRNRTQSHRWLYRGSTRPKSPSKTWHCAL